MKVLQVYKTYLPDSFTGTERVIWELAEGSAKRGVEQRVLSLSVSPSPGPVSVGSHLVYRARQDISIASSGFSVSAASLYRELWDWADILHFHYPWPMMDLLHLTQVARKTKPSIVTYHSDIVRQRMLGRLYAPVRNAFLRDVDRIVATSVDYLASSSILQRYRSKVSVIPLGLTERTAPAAASVEGWRQRLGDSFFLFVGAARYYKGLPYLLQAARSTGLPVVLAGAFDASMLAGPVPANVTVLGEVDDATKEILLLLCRALVLPSHVRSEAFGLVLVEASRAGKPMISCKIGTGTSYVNRNGITGIEIEPANSGALAEAMRMLWADREFAQRLGNSARERYSRELTGDKMIDGYCRLYDGLLTERALALQGGRRPQAERRERPAVNPVAARLSEPSLKHRAQYNGFVDAASAKAPD